MAASSPWSGRFFRRAIFLISKSASIRHVQGQSFFSSAACSFISFSSRLSLLKTSSRYLIPSSKRCKLSRRLCCLCLSSNILTSLISVKMILHNVLLVVSPSLSIFSTNECRPIFKAKLKALSAIERPSSIISSQL